jgi:hypothetical protein
MTCLILEKGIDQSLARTERPGEAQSNMAFEQQKTNYMQQTVTRAETILQKTK